MTIQDISYIMTIMEEMSITKAADKLFLSQPSLSKCIKKVEKEYGITLFHRAKGSSLVLTEAGRRFREMGIGVLQQHQLFVHQMEQLKSRNDTNIVFGATMQRAYDMSGPVMKWIFENAPGYSMELKTLSSSKIPQEIIAGNLDIAVVPNQTQEPGLYFLPLIQADTYLYLRSGSDAGTLAQHQEGLPYPVLSLKAISGEQIIENRVGTGGRIATEAVIRQSGADVTILEQPLYSVRITMVNAGYASTLVSAEAIRQLQNLDASRLYCLPQNENYIRSTYLVCRKEYLRDRRFSIMKEALAVYYANVK